MTKKNAAIGHTTIDNKTPNVQKRQDMNARINPKTEIARLPIYCPPVYGVLSKTHQKGSHEPRIHPLLRLLCAFFLFISLTIPLFADGDTAPDLREWQKWFIAPEQIPLLSVEPMLRMPRQRFEHLVKQFEDQPEEQRTEHPHFSKILLHAALDGRHVSGTGTFALHPHAEGSRLIPLNPLTLAVHSLYWTEGEDEEDGEEAVFFHEPENGNQLLVPSATDSHFYDQLQFRWSLQSRRDVRTGIVFDLALPPSLSIELQFELPKSQTLASSSGLVLPVADESGTQEEDSERRTWRVLLGHHSRTTLTITEDKTLPASVKPKSGIHQRVSYAITPQGLEAQTRITFDRGDVRPSELVLELEMPLRPTQVTYGNRPAPWSRLAVSPDVTAVWVDLSPFSGEESQELLIESLGPLRENQRWMLPRMRVTSPDIFWQATRCNVSVYPPLRARNLTHYQAVQVPSRNPVDDWAQRELYVFQYFQDDAQIELEVVYSIPPVTVTSAAQVVLRDNEIRSTVYLECSVTEGERFTLNFPLSEHWTVDSVIPYAPSILPGESMPVFSWDVLEGTPSQTLSTLSIQLDSPLRPRQPIMLQLSCRFNNSSQNHFRLAEFSPLLLAHRRVEEHHLAIRPDLTAHTLTSSVNASVFNVANVFKFSGNTQVPLAGGVYPLNFRTQDIRFELERTRSSHTAEISGTIYVNEDGLVPVFRIQCSQIEPSLSRICVHFTPFGGEGLSETWDWSLVGATDVSRPIRVRQISPEDFRNLLNPSEQQHWNEYLYSGILWEIRFEELQQTPFEISATSLIPLADSMLIPLASVPLASSQRGELSIVSPQHFNYRVVGGQHNSIPVAPPAWNRYQDVRAAFRYDPMEELRRAQHTPLLLQRLTPEEQFDTAWVWSLRLDSQYDSEGTVRNRALFLVENQGRGTLQIKLPRGIDAAKVSAVWRDSQQIPWQYEAEYGTIDISLPTGQRFVSIALEYTLQDLPLVQQRKLRPHYPLADVPILSGSWIAWFPPEFDVSLRHAALGTGREPSSPLLISKALDYLLGGTYRSFFGAEWDNAFYGKQRRKEAEAAAHYFFDALVELLEENPISTWGELLGNERLLSAVRFKLADTRRDAVTRLLIDRQALTFLGITPSTPIGNTALINSTNVREKLFEQTGLVLLIAVRSLADGSREYILALTTPTTLSLNRQFHTTPSGHCVRIVPFAFFDAVSPASPEWTSVPRWIQETTLSSIPWAVAAQVMQGTALTMDWNAYELPMDAEQPLYIVHRQKFLALQWLAFLTVVLITCRKPFSSPVFLLMLLIMFELTARSVAPCYIGIPSGALLGVLVSLAFVLIRTRLIPRESLRESPPRDDSTECSVSFVPTSFLVRSVLLFSGLLGLSAAVAAQETARTEPYRVFYPVDAEGQPAGDDVWLPWELSLLLQNAQSARSEDSQRWHITKAVYQGSLIRSAQGILECADDFKAVYEIYLDSSSATVTLPNLPAVPGRFLWNSQPIQPILQDDAAGDSLSFLIENETPGKHLLEVGLAPKAVQQHTETAALISFAVPAVPQSSLRLNVPPNAPSLNVPEALGAVQVNTPLSPILTAELGPAEQLAFSWVDDPHQSGALVSEVEQFLWLRLKPSQNELEVLFRYHIGGGTVQQLTIQTDPRWSPSGQFWCVEYPTTMMDFPSLDSSHNVSVIEFQTPVSGTITLRRDFVLRTFDGTPRILGGIGNLRLPEFRALQARTTKSMLGISADPLLELNLPLEGRSGDFESGWYGTSAAVVLPIFSHNLWEIMGEAFARRDETDRERPEAAYDLTQTEPTWTLNIRAKKAACEAAVVQSVLLDAHESRVHIVGELTAQTYVFRQYFSTDRPIQIESIEVHNAQGTIVESRLQQIAPETNPHQYILFFKNHVTGRYTVTLRGFFETDTREAAPLQALPMLTFEGVQITEHSQNIFRTSAVIAEISSEQSGWVKSRAIPMAPESFAQPRPLGTWQKAELPLSAPPERETADESSLPTPLLFTLSLNRPQVKSRTLLSLVEEHADQWVMMLDFTADITGGEVDSLSFRWDERCGVIQSLEPNTAVSSLSTQGGVPILTLLPAEPLRGEQQFKMAVSLNTTGAMVALPNVFPMEDRNIDRLESELLVELPLRRGNEMNSEMISWELTMLESIDEQEEDALRAVYRAADTQFAATISQAETRLTAQFYDIGFLVMRDGTVTGAVTVDLRNRGQDSFILQMPPGYVPLQISSAGSIVDRTRLDDDQRWRIHIGSSDYPQRLNILFRTLLPHPIRQWSREQIVSTLQFPALEGVAVQDTLWTIAFEGNVPALHLTSLLEPHGSYKTALPSYETGGQNHGLDTHIPLSGREATLTLIGMNLIREHNLIRALDSIPVSARQEEVRRWFLHWAEEWKTVADQVDFQAAHLPLTLQNVKSNLIFRSADSAAEREKTTGMVRLFLETMHSGTREALRLSKERSVTEKIGTTTGIPAEQSVPILNSQVYWQGRISDEMRYLFGTEEGAVRAITLTSLPGEREWTGWFSEHIHLWTSLALLLPIFVLLSVRWIHITELWFQFPHFWGMAIGVLLWTFLPESFLGIIIIILTLLSFFRPSWSRRPSMPKPF